MNPAIRFVDYGFTYASGSKPAIENVNLVLEPGRVTSVISPQGTGKTTLLRAVAGLLGEIYQGEIQGSIETGSEGGAPNSRKTDEPNNRPTFLTRNASAFFDGYVQVTLAVETVREEIGLPLFAEGASRAERDKRAIAVCRELGIEYLLDRHVTHLSGGEEKLVGIAAALAPDVSIYVLDEPFEQLDVAHLAAVIRAIKRRVRAGRLVFVSTGALDIALNIADSAVVFADGVWRCIDRPTYADVAGITSLGASPVMNFLAHHHRDSTGVRRFRDAARVAS